MISADAVVPKAAYRCRARHHEALTAEHLGKFHSLPLEHVTPPKIVGGNGTCRVLLNRYGSMGGDQ